MRRHVPLDERGDASRSDLLMQRGIDLGTDGYG